MSNKVPKIRFNGYSDAWVQRKLSDISKKVIEKNVNNEFSETLTNSAEYGIISQRDFFDKDISNEKNLNTYYVVHDGDFVYNPRISNYAPVGPIKRNTLGRTGVMSPLYYVFTTYNVDGTYLEKYFSSTKWHRFMEMNGDTGARSDRFAIKDKDFVQMPIPLPRLDEQVKIARFLKDVENLITANQRKLDLLKEQKKGYLQKMFPKNGAKVPELRFAGFADDWEERKLEEVLRERNNQQSQSLEYPLVSFTVEKGVTPKTDRYEREQLVVGDKSSKKYKVTVLNDLVYNPANLKFGAISRNKYGNAVFSPIYITFVVNNDVTTPEFIEMFVTRNDFIKRALKYQQGTVYERQSVSPADLLSMVLYLPGKAEQEKIGSFFAQLDNTIALHQRKLDLLKEQKKGFLQKMFV